MKQVSVHDLLRKRLMDRAGLADTSLKLPSHYRLEWLWRSEWSREFETYMRNRLVMGAIRHGLLGALDKPKYDRIGSIKKRIEVYRKTGNLETLVDIANLALVEFVEGRHPLRHWGPTDDGIHAEII